MSGDGHRPAPGVSTHAPLAGSDGIEESGEATISGVSTHAPLAGSDPNWAETARRAPRFQPTLPLRGATSDPCPSWPTCRFNPRSPCGERRSSGAAFMSASESFQPTLPLRGATLMSARCTERAGCFNPRSPCGERRGARPPGRATGCFNPRSPCGERPATPGSPPRRSSSCARRPTGTRRPGRCRSARGRSRRRGRGWRRRWPPG